MDNEEDFLEELIAKREIRNPNIRAMIEAEVQRRLALLARGKDPNGEPESEDAQEAQEQQPAVIHPQA